MKSALCMIAIGAFAGMASAQLDEGDIGLSIVDNRIVTSLIPEGEKKAPRGVTLVPQRLFIGELGKVEF